MSFEALQRPLVAPWAALALRRTGHNGLQTPQRQEPEPLETVPEEEIIVTTRELAVR